MIHYKKIQILNAKSYWQVPGFLCDILYLTAVLNSCINPPIYGHYFYSEGRGRGGGSTQATSFRYSTTMLTTTSSSRNITRRNTHSSKPSIQEDNIDPDGPNHETGF